MVQQLDQQRPEQVDAEQPSGRKTESEHIEAGLPQSENDALHEERRRDETGDY